MRNFVKILVIILACVVCVSALLSFLGTVLGATFGVIGSLFGFLWRVVFSPAVLVVLIIIGAVKLSKNRRNKGG